MVVIFECMHAGTLGISASLRELSGMEFIGEVMSVISLAQAWEGTHNNIKNPKPQYERQVK